jgi:hypothetical protein
MIKSKPFSKWIQVHSDIHLERFPQRRLFALAPLLILAGDIGVPTKPSYVPFFKETCPHFDQVIYVLGNHEYEGVWMTKSSDQEKIKYLEERKFMILDLLSSIRNLIILDNQKFVYQGKSYYGTTLWTHYSYPQTFAQRWMTKCHWEAKSLIQPSDTFISHYVSQSSVLRKWEPGLGPFLFPQVAQNYIFGHIHSPIHVKNSSMQIICNPWGEKDHCSHRLFDV